MRERNTKIFIFLLSFIFQSDDETLPDIPIQEAGAGGSDEAASIWGGVQEEVGGSEAAVGSSNLEGQPRPSAKRRQELKIDWTPKKVKFPSDEAEKKEEEAEKRREARRKRKEEDSDKKK